MGVSLEHESRDMTSLHVAVMVFHNVWVRLAPKHFHYFRLFHQPLWKKMDHFML